MRTHMLTYNFVFGVPGSLANANCAGGDDQGVGPRDWQEVAAIRFGQDQAALGRV